MHSKKYALILSFPILLFLNYSLSHANTFSDQDCLSCHGKPEISQITAEGNIRSIHVNPEDWNQDVHHKSQMTCVDCHTNANPYLHFREGFIDVDCSRCHPEEAEEYQKNIHFNFKPVSANKELPLCYHCHTKHHVLRHDDSSSSIHEKNIGETCGECHAEVMVKGILKGTSLGKITGHRKGSLAEMFDMKVCINCHYDDAAHGAKRIYKDYCSRCHDVRAKGSFVMGPTHLDSARWTGLNYTGGALAALLLIGTFFFLGHKSRKGIAAAIKAWYMNMKLDNKKPSGKVNSEQEKDNKE